MTGPDEFTTRDGKAWLGGWKNDFIMNNVCNEVDTNKVQRWGKGFRAPRQTGEEEEAQNSNLPPSAPPVLRSELLRTTSKWGLHWHQNRPSDSPSFNKREDGLLINTAA